MAKTWEDLDEEEFRKILENLASEEYGQLTDEEFFGTLAQIAEGHYSKGSEEELQTEIILTGEIVNGKIVFDKSVPLEVHGNKILITDKTIIVNLRLPAEFVALKS